MRERGCEEERRDRPWRRLARTESKGCNVESGTGFGALEINTVSSWVALSWINSSESEMALEKRRRMGVGVSGRVSHLGKRGKWTVLDERGEREVGRLGLERVKQIQPLLGLCTQRKSLVNQFPSSPVQAGKRTDRR